MKSTPPLVIPNTGLIILAPFLPALHQRCGLLVDGFFRDFAAAGHAVHLLQFLVTEKPRPAGNLLALNQLLCGLAPETPLGADVELSETDRSAAHALLASVASQWPRGAAISRDGLRSSYLQRPGLLKRSETGWHLQVEQRGWDVLLPELPWSFPGVKPKWMPEPLHVDWI